MITFFERQPDSSSRAVGAFVSCGEAIVPQANRVVDRADRLDVDLAEAELSRGVEPVEVQGLAVPQAHVGEPILGQLRGGIGGKIPAGCCS